MLDGLDERGLLLGVEQLLWPPDRPLPYPTWGGVARRLFIDSMERFETLVERLTECVRRQLTDHCYNTIGNFLTCVSDDCYQPTAAGFAPRELMS